ncbi:MULTISPECIES: hypothetical protein [unclassified Pseudomonas]|uniref:hypothetical protein n=1 Tax=unclassified Pseudomonas TaxID=196821 RepID=UPI001F56563E|nr:MULTISPECIES: hypothetical protein [unclassified Pseudomonas]
MLLAILGCKRLADERLHSADFPQVRKIVQARKANLLAQSPTVFLVEERLCLTQ